MPLTGDRSTNQSKERPFALSSLGRLNVPPQVIDLVGVGQGRCQDQLLKLDVPLTGLLMGA